MTVKGPLELHAFDLDHTLLTVNSAYHFARFLFRERVLSFKEIAYLIFFYARHKLGLSMPMRELHHRIFQRIFRGRSLEDFERQLPLYLKDVCESLYYQPACDRLRTAQASGHHTVIISSSTAFVVAPHADRLGVGEFYTTEYASDKEGRLSHMLRLVEGMDKAEILLTVAERLGVERENIFAYSDSHLDLPFLEAAGTAIGVKPDRLLREVCVERDWELI